MGVPTIGDLVVYHRAEADETKPSTQAAIVTNIAAPADDPDYTRVTCNLLVFTDGSTTMTVKKDVPTEPHQVADKDGKKGEFYSTKTYV